MTPDEALYRELFMAELWPTCRELDPGERAVERALAEVRDEALMSAGLLGDGPLTCENGGVGISRPPGSSTVTAVSPRGLATPSKRSD